MDGPDRFERDPALAFFEPGTRRRSVAAHDDTEPLLGPSGQRPKTSRGPEYASLDSLQHSVTIEDMRDPRMRPILAGSLSSTQSGNADGIFSRHGSASTPGILEPQDSGMPSGPGDTVGSAGSPKMTATTEALEQQRQGMEADIVRVFRSNYARGHGVFALGNMTENTRIIYEAPLISGENRRHQWWAPNEINLAWSNSSQDGRDVIQREFNRPLNGMSTEADLDRRQRKQLRAFVKEYAFKETGGRRLHVYRLASHINHACGRCANARVRMDFTGDQNRMAVTLIKPVNTGDEIFINYEKWNLFSCPVCGTKRMRRRPDSRRDMSVNPPEAQQPPQENAQQSVEGQQQHAEARQRPRQAIHRSFRHRLQAIFFGGEYGGFGGVAYQSL